MRSLLLTALLALASLVASAAAAQDNTHFAIGGEALRDQDWEAAEVHFAAAQQEATGDERNAATYWLAFSIFKQGEGIVRGLDAQDTTSARRALELFERSRTVVQDTTHPQREGMEQTIAALVDLLSPLVGPP